MEGICQFARRGGILDIFPPDRSEPVRIEFWDDEIDTMSTFQVDTQRRQDSIEQVTIPPAREVLYQSPQKLADLLRQQMAAQKGKAGVQVKEHLQRDIERLEGGLNPVSIDRYLPILYQPQTIFDYFEADALAFLCEPVSCKENFANAMAQHHEDVKMLMEQGILFRGCSVYYDDFTELCRKFCRCQSVMMDTFTRSLSDVPVRELVQLSASQLSTWSGEYAILKDDIEDYMKTGFCCVIFAGTPRGAQALTEDLQKDFSAQLGCSFHRPGQNLCAGRDFVGGHGVSAAEAGGHQPCQNRQQPQKAGKSQKGRNQKYFGPECGRLCGTRFPRNRHL